MGLISRVSSRTYRNWQVFRPPNLPDMSAADNSQVLPSREQTQFNKLIKHYDSKQYRLGLQCCKKILAKHPNNGETLSMKALIMNATGKRDEAMALAKDGLRNNFKSATCWHVVGILESRERNYEKALTAYKNAIRQEPKNYVVLRDLSCMQHILRKYDEYRQTRLDMIPLKPSQNMSWIGFAMANYFNKDTELALAVLDNFRESMEKSTQENSSDRYDISEILIFSCQMLYMDGEYEAALKVLSENEGKIVDTVARMELYANLYMELGRWSEAEKTVTWLIERNPDHNQYYKSLEKIICPDGDENKLIMYDVVSQRFPRALTPKRIPLDFLPADHPEFATRLADYLRVGIKKGRPALFQDIKPLYCQAGKAQVVEACIVAIVNDEKLNPSCFPWSCYFLSKHYTMMGQFKQGLDFAKRGLDHTPTLVELLVVKAKVLKKMGDLASAIDTIDEAQSMDTAYRYTNCIACKYLLQAGEIKRAEEMLAKFVRETTNVVDYLRELQVIWFEEQAAKVAYKTKNYGEALRRCQLIKRIFTDMFEDQFEFLQYCLRRTTMVSFSEFISFQDILMSHRSFEQASYIASRIYLKLHKDREAVVSAEPTMKIEVTIPETKPDNSDEGWGPRKEAPITAEETLKTTDPLGELAEFVTQLEKHQPGTVQNTPAIPDLASNQSCLKLSHQQS